MGQCRKMSKSVENKWDFSLSNFVETIDGGETYCYNKITVNAGKLQKRL